MQLLPGWYTGDFIDPEVKMKHGSQIPIEDFAASAEHLIWTMQCIANIHAYLPTYLLTCTQNTAHIWSLVRASRVIGVMTWRVSPLMPLKERPDDELCSLKLDGVMHRIAAPGIGVWMLWPWIYPGGAFPTNQKNTLKSDLKKLREFGGEMW